MVCGSTPKLRASLTWHGEGAKRRTQKKTRKRSLEGDKGENDIKDGSLKMGGGDKETRREITESKGFGDVTLKQLQAVFNFSPFHMTDDC